MKRKDSISHPEFLATIGFGRADITPPDGMFARIWPRSTHEVASGVHKPLYASCVLFRSLESDLELYLISADLSYWKSNAEESEIRTSILDQCQLLENQLIFHLSHSHSAPYTHLGNVDRPGGDLIQAFRDKIVTGCIAAIEEARKTAGKSCLTWAYGTCQLAHNRDQSVKTDNGLTTVVGLDPMVAADDTLLVGRIVDAENNIQAVLVNYACHPVSLGSGNSKISPDYVGKMREIVEAETGNGLCVFLHGASGDLGPKISYSSDTEAADQNGREIGYAVLSTLASMLPAQASLDYDGIEESGAPLGRWKLNSNPASSKLVADSASVTLSYFNLPTLQEIDRSIERAKDGYMRARLTRRRLLRADMGMGNEKSRVVTFPIWQLGRSIIVALPAEAYSEFQQSLRRRFPDMAIVVLNIANGYFSYLPPEEAYEVPDLYQVKVALFEKGCMEKAAEHAGAIIDRLVGVPTT